MPISFRPTDRPERSAIPFLLAIVGLLALLLGPAAGRALAQEEVASEQEISQESVPGNDSSGGGDAGMPEGISVGNGEAVAKDAYAGHGCAKAGDISAGNCEKKARKGEKAGPGASGAQSGLSETSPETTTQQTTSEETILQQTTILQESTNPGTTSSAPASPAPDENGPCPAGPPKDAVEASIEAATDGDTVSLAEEVDGHDTVRLIGVDTPELEGEDGAPEPGAEESAAFTAEELEGRDVLLQVGEEETDKYERLLAYVWTSEATEDGVVGGIKRLVGVGDPQLFNLSLLEDGYARVLTIEPNDLYAECFEAAEGDAREAGVGIWADEPSDDPAETQYEETAPQATTGISPPPDTTPAENTPTGDAPEASATPEEDLPREAPERWSSPAEAQYGQSPPPEARSPEPETQEEEVRDEEIQEPEIREPVSLSGGDEAAVLETPARSEPGASPAASVGAGASPEPVADLPTRAAPTGAVSVLPETGGPSLLSPSPGLGVAGLPAGTAMVFLAVRTFLKRAYPGGR